MSAAAGGGEIRKVNAAPDKTWFVTGPSNRRQLPPPYPQHPDGHLVEYAGQDTQ